MEKQFSRYRCTGQLDSKKHLPAGQLVGTYDTNYAAVGGRSGPNCKPAWDSIYWGAGVVLSVFKGKRTKSMYPASND